MAYFDENFVEEKREEKTSQSITELLFEEKECSFGNKRFSVRLPKKPLVNAIFKQTPAGLA